MGRARGVGAGLAVAAALALAVVGPSAQAQTPELYRGVTVTPAVVSTPNTEITVSGPRFPDGAGCVSGAVLAVPAGQPLEQAVPVVTGVDLNSTAGSDETFSVGDRASALPFKAGEYRIFLGCSERGVTTTFSTEASLTIAPSALAASTAAGAVVTVEPTTATPGETTISVRGRGFKAGAPLQINLATTPVLALATTTADPDGAYEAALKLPVTAPPGRQQVLVTGPGPTADGAARSTTATLTVVDLDCASFATPQAAQAALGSGDPHGLDADSDGVACDPESGGGVGAAGTTAGGTAAGGTLVATGSSRLTFLATVGLAAMTLGALLVALSHPPVPVDPTTRRRRRPSRP